MNTRSGLNVRIIRTTCIRYRFVSSHQWNFEVPARSAYSIGTYFTV